MTSLSVGGGAKCEVLPSARWRDAPDARLTSFNILTPGCVFFWGVGWLMRGIKIPQQDLALKMQRGLCVCGGGRYLWDTMVLPYLF